MAPALRNIAILLLKISVSSLALWAVLRKTDASHILQLLLQIGPLTILGIVCLYLCSQVLSTFRWRALLFEDFGFKRLFSLYMIGAFFNSFMPGVIGGDAVKAYYLNKDAKKLSLTLASIFMDRYTGFVALITIGILAFPMARQYFAGTAYQWLMPSIFISFVIGSLLFFGLQIGRQFRRIGEIYRYFAKLRRHYRVIGKALALSFLIQILNILMVIMLSIRLDASIPFLSLFVFLPIVITITTLPISISGLGVREGAFVILLGLIGVKAEVATSLSLAFFFSTFIGSLPGLVAYIIETRNAPIPENLNGRV